jgi:hypothetical protein
MTVNAESRMKQGRIRKRIVILALFAIAIAFYAGSIIVMSG